MTQMNPSSYGLIPEQSFREAASAPHGQSVKILRKFDPLWGRGVGEKKEMLEKLTGDLSELQDQKEGLENEISALENDLSDAGFILIYRITVWTRGQ